MISITPLRGYSNVFRHYPGANAPAVIDIKVDLNGKTGKSNVVYSVKRRAPFSMALLVEAFFELPHKADKMFDTKLVNLLAMDIKCPQDPTTTTQLIDVINKRDFVVTDYFDNTDPDFHYVVSSVNLINTWFEFFRDGVIVKALSPASQRIAETLIGVDLVDESEEGMTLLFSLLYMTIANLRDGRKYG